MSVNLPQQQHKMVVYKARDGQEVQLTVDIVRNFLVTGKKELVTLQEFVYFMGVCKSRGLNPFAKDCYLIKYTENEPAAIITSIDFYRSRARAQADCTGWEKGIICMNEKTGELRYSKGLLLPDEKLVGGWFRAKPKGWEVPFELEVNLDGYIKRTKDGRITQFWSPEKQATMIAKVAESQGLRTLWPDEFRGTVTAEEANVQIDNFETMELDSLPTPETTEEEAPEIQEFEQAIAAKELDPIRQHNLGVFLQECATANSRKSQTPVTVADIKIRAAKDFDRFWAAFEHWEIKQQLAPQSETTGEYPQNETPTSDIPSETVAEPEVSEPEPEPEPEQTNQTELKEALQALYSQATRKNIVGLVLEQFKMSQWEDFLAFPEMFGTLEAFISNYKEPRGRGRK